MSKPSSDISLYSWFLFPPMMIYLSQLNYLWSLSLIDVSCKFFLPLIPCVIVMTSVIWFSLIIMLYNVSMIPFYIDIVYYSIFFLHYINADLLFFFFQTLVLMRVSIWFHLWWVPFIMEIDIIYVHVKNNGIFYPLILVFCYSSLWDNTIIFNMCIMHLKFKLFKYSLMTFSNIFFLLFLKLEGDIFH